MPKRPKDYSSDELKRLITEQESDRRGRHTFPERITPRCPKLFSALPPRQRACFILSFFMRRREIAQALFIKPSSVSKYLKRGFKSLSDKEIYRYRAIKKGMSTELS